MNFSEYNFSIDYDIQLNEKIDKHGDIGTYLLDLSKNNYNAIEKFVYDTVFFHCVENNIDFNNIYIEFWCKKQINLNGFHVDCDEFLKKQEKYKYIYPLLSCVSYFDDNLCFPTTLTTIDIEKYLYKEFENEKKIVLSFPKKNKQITFDGKYMHGVTKIIDKEDMSQRKIIAINIWNIKPEKVEYYTPDDICLDDTNIFKTSFIKINYEIPNVYITNKIINYDFFEKILYKRDNNIVFLYDFVKEFLINSTITIVIGNDNEKILKTLKANLTDIDRDFEEIKNINNIFKPNRFFQRFIYPKLFTSEICEWIINESEYYAEKNGGWTTKRHRNYPTTDLPAQNIPHIFNFLLVPLNTICGFIKKSYCLNSDFVIDIIDIFIVKYNDYNQNYLDFHVDGSIISFNILLSDPVSFKGGGTCFNDGLIYNISQGDVLIHSGKIKHAGLPVIEGNRYLIVGFLDILKT